MQTQPLTKRDGGAEALRKTLRKGLNRFFTDPLVALLRRTGITPNTLSLIGLAGGIGAAVLLAYGYELAGGALVLGGSALDLLDGALARATQRVTKVGALLDSTLDRVAEGAILAGMLYHYAQRGDTQIQLLLFAALVGSVLVSYVKARAEGLGLSCNVGLVTRPERIVLLGVGLLSGQVTAFLYILTIMSFITAGHRYVHAARQASKLP